MTFSKSSMTTTVLAALMLPGASASAGTCAKFSSVYTSGEDIANKMWDGAFAYETDNTKAYTMWPVGSENNDLTKLLVDDGKVTDGHFNADGLVDQCYLQYYHKNATSEVDNNVHPENDPSDFKVCTPWADRSCCNHETVSSIDKMKADYGGGWGTYYLTWCGKSATDLSASCAKFFWEEACFYECSPNAGLFRKFLDKANGHGNAGQHAAEYDSTIHAGDEWMMWDMPIKASYWDAWHAACADETICLGGTDEKSCDFSGASAAAPTLLGAALVGSVMAMW